MDRSFAHRSSVGRPGRPFGAAGLRPRAVSTGRAGTGRARSAGWIGRTLGAVAGRALAAVAGHRRARIAVLLALLATPLLAGGWLWLRSSPLVSVQHVRVSGLHGPDAAKIDAALLAAAQHMSTLHLNTGALRDAVAPFAVVRDVRATPEFPHGLRIQVIEQLPVAALTLAGARTAVAADGMVLGPALLSGSLPSLSAAYEPAVAQRVRDPSLLASLTVLGAAPAPLARLVKNVFAGPQGLTVAMRNGLLAYFGDATRPHAKWLSLARVLADPSSAGASYVDVRLPARPAAGFPAGVAPPAAPTAEGGSSTAERTATTESTVAALAAGLTAAHGGSSIGAGAAAGTPPAGASSSSPASEASAPPSSEAGSPATAEGAAEASESAPPAGG